MKLRSFFDRTSGFSSLSGIRDRTTLLLLLLALVAWTAGFSLWRDEAELTIRPRFFWLTLRDGLVLLLAIPLFELIDVAQVSGAFGTMVLLR